MAKWLFDAGIDIFLIETMNTIREAKVAVEVASKFDLPIWLGMTVNQEGNLLSGETWNQLLKSLVLILLIIIAQIFPFVEILFLTRSGPFPDVTIHL